MSVLSGWCTLALGHALTTYTPKLRPTKFLFLALGVPLHPLYPLATPMQKYTADASCTKIYEIILILKSIHI